MWKDFSAKFFNNPRHANTRINKIRDTPSVAFRFVLVASCCRHYLFRLLLTLCTHFFDVLTAFPIRGTNWLMEVTLSHKITIIIDCNRQLWECVTCRTEYNLAFICRIKSRLMARAQQMVRSLLVQRDGTSNVCTDLRISDYTVNVPVFAFFRNLHLIGLKTHQQDNCFSFFL